MKKYYMLIIIILLIMMQILNLVAYSEEAEVLFQSKELTEEEVDSFGVCFH